MAPLQTATITVEERRAAVARIQKLPVDVDYYDVLQVQDDCNASEIRKSYKILSLLVHPDKAAVAGVQGANEAFKVVLDAYQTLNDPTKRAVYDTGRRSSTGFANNAGAQASASGAGAATGSASTAHSQPSQSKKSSKNSKKRRRRETQARAEAEMIWQRLAEIQHDILRNYGLAEVLHKLLLFCGVGTLVYFGWKILCWVLVSGTMTSTLLAIAAWVAFQAFAPTLWAKGVYRVTRVIIALSIALYVLVPLTKGGVDVLLGATRMLLGVVSSSARYSYSAASASASLAYTGAAYVFTSTPGRVGVGGAVTYLLHGIPSAMRTDIFKLCAAVPMFYAAYHAVVALCTAVYAVVSAPAAGHILSGALAAGIVLHMLPRLPRVTRSRYRRPRSTLS
ncbi:DnaJ-domain-containing protein [Exidia glandulosa HHB12029]|uniref:DnaJ-domain-containing protein n=1 Tax=Exidia glandulosa HHB12029 TaxID=1314781 RepID=A0A165B4X6_EXIGL|nr:DnaJ-domain-containing protein [Exidia glandulosa HHB12029]